MWDIAYCGNGESRPKQLPRKRLLLKISLTHIIILLSFKTSFFVTPNYVSCDKFFSYATQKHESSKKVVKLIKNAPAAISAGES